MKEHDKVQSSEEEMKSQIRAIPFSSLTTKRCILLYALHFHYDRHMDILDALLRKHLKNFTFGLSCVVVRKISVKIDTEKIKYI